jgi:hypothetical protein
MLPVKTAVSDGEAGAGCGAEGVDVCIGAGELAQPFNANAKLASRTFMPVSILRLLVLACPN